MSKEATYIGTAPPGNDSAEEIRHEKTNTEDDALEHIATRFGDDGPDGLAPRDDIQRVMDKVDQLSIDDAKTILQDILKDHEYDYNFAETTRQKMEALLEGPGEGQKEVDWRLEIKTEAALNKFYSPYPEVRAVTTPDDDPDMTCETIRAHLLGYIWAVIAQFTNTLFVSRFPSISITSQVAQMLLYPCGLAWAYVFPDWGFNFRGKRISLNPGPWTYKEQMLSTIIINVGLGTAYVFYNIQTQTIFYHDKWLTPGYEILLVLSTQMMGLGFAGMMRRFVVYPIEAIWPSILPTVALNRALLVPESRETIHGWRLTRYQWFFLAFGIMFIYFWIPDYLFTGLSTFAWMCWIAPNNFKLNLITGSQQGLGFNPIPTFDWNVINYIAYPLQAPFFATMQQFAGSLIAAMVIIGLYFTNNSGTAYLPINSSGIFNNTGGSYEIEKIIIPGTTIVNETAYQAYSPAFYSAGNLMVYGAFFAFYPLTMVFICLDAWKPLLKAFKSMFASAVSFVKRLITMTGNIIGCIFTGRFQEASRHVVKMTSVDESIYDGFDDPLANLMRHYPEVPDWWFLIIALISFIFAIIILTKWTELATPVWSIFFVIGLNLAFLIPMSYLYAISGTTEGLNVVTELIVGYALPGHPEALMFVKAYGYNINGQTDNYVGDQKMGYYGKIPPRAMYRGQITSAFITALVCYATINFVDTSIEGICTPDQPQKFTCVATSVVFFSASVVWGALGPKRIFNQIYPTIKYCFLFGFLLGLAWWTVKRSGPKIRNAARSVLPSGLFKVVNAALFVPISWLKHVHPSLIFNGMLLWAPYNLSYWWGGVYVSFAFMWYMKRYKTAWWEKYNYVTSAALTAGVAFSAIIIFFAVEWKTVDVNWWGNSINSKTMDGGGGNAPLVLRTEMPPKGYFGPGTWF
ncbi:oligopeptide transporter 6 [Lecanicillium sp. MT-2017a]|nr:oligopeptide transporter 6 [Lecanicillium sp. MT-2017a]